MRIQVVTEENKLINFIGSTDYFLKNKKIIVQNFFCNYICRNMTKANTFFSFYFSFFYFRMKPGMLLLKTR